MSGLNITAARAREVADAIDSYDEQIKTLQEGKRETFASVRAELEDLGLDRANIRDELAALKAAIVKRAKRRDDAEAVDERDAMTDSYLDLIERSAPRATHAIANTVPSKQSSVAGIAREGTAQNTPERPSNRDVSAVDKSSSEVGPQAEASLAGTGSETLAGREGRPEEHPGSRPEMGVRTAQPIPSPAVDEPIKGLAAANAIAARAAQATPHQPPRADVDIEIPAFLRRTTAGNHPSFGEQA